MTRPPYTDYLGNPIAVGDVIAYPTARGSSSAAMNLAVVNAIEDLIPNNPLNPSDRSATMHRDRNRAYAPSREILGKWVKTAAQNGLGDYYRDDSKAYMLSVTKLMEDSGHLYIPSKRPTLLKNVDRVVVVTPLVDQSILDL